MLLKGRSTGIGCRNPEIADDQVEVTRLKHFTGFMRSSGPVPPKVKGQRSKAMEQTLNVLVSVFDNQDVKHLAALDQARGSGMMFPSESDATPR
jgi:hypothetical protein